MRTLVPTGYGLIQFVWSLDGLTRKMTSAIGCSLTAAATATTAAQVYTAWYFAWRDRLPTAYRFRAVRIYNGDDTNSPPYVEYLQSTAGLNANTLLLPPNVTHVVQVNTALGGRYGKGRMFFPGDKEGGVDNLGNHDGAGLATYNASLATLKTNIEAVANIGNLYLIGHGGHAPVQVTTLTMRTKVGTQVNRLRKLL